MLVFTYLWLPFMILPIYAGLERIPSSLLEASADLGGAVGADIYKVDAAARLPGRRRRLDLHVLAHARGLHRAGLISNQQYIGTVIYAERGVNLPVAAAYTFVPIVDHDDRIS